MNVHNLMEELVFSQVHDLFDTAKKNRTDWLTCTCAQCRLDTICYVLNRIQPRYIKSGRGLAYSQLEESFDKAQLAADINFLAIDGMHQVMSTRRPHNNSDTDMPELPVFNFPTFVGRILDGLTFEPVHDIDVELIQGTNSALPIDQSWENPYHISEHTPGTYTFWVKPQKADAEGVNKVFPFAIRVSREGCDPIEYFFELGLTSETFLRTAYSADHCWFLPDLHLFPKEPVTDD